MERIEGPEAMKNRLEHYRELARQRIHPTQDTIEQGSYFIFMDDDEVQYAYWPSLMELLADAQGDDPSPVSLAPFAQQWAGGVASGSVFGITGPTEYLQMHKSMCWPIEAVDYEAAKAVGFCWQAIPTANRINIEAAQRGLAEHHRRLAEAS